RQLEDLPRLAGQLPRVDEVVLESDRSRVAIGATQNDPKHLENILSVAERLAVRHRDPGDSEADVRLRVRRRVRSLLDDLAAYERERPELVLALRMKDRAFARLIAPPGQDAPVRSIVKDVLEADKELMECEERLVALWISCQTGRLALY